MTQPFSVTCAYAYDWLSENPAFKMKCVLGIASSVSRSYRLTSFICSELV